MQKKPKFNGIYIAVLLALIMMVMAIFSFMGNDRSTMSYSQVVSYFKNNQVTAFDLDLNTGVITLSLKEGAVELPQTTQQPTPAGGGLLSNMMGAQEQTGPQNGGTVLVSYKLPYTAYFLESMQDYIDAYDEANPDAPMVYDMARIKNTIPWTEIIFYGLLLCSMGFVFFNMYRGGMGGGGVMNVGRAKVKDQQENQRKATFADVAGADEEKEELAEIVEFLKAPHPVQLPGRPHPPRRTAGGPSGHRQDPAGPGRARARRGCPSILSPAPTFVEMYVGVGASRVRDLFDKAKKSMPCIIFIDEIDAVGRQRGAGLGGGHDEREQTLNQLLVEMDGFDANEGVIVIAATNRADILDKALLRPGRFDRQVYVGLPDVKGREEILQGAHPQQAPGPRRGPENHRQIHRTGSPAPTWKTW